MKKKNYIKPDYQHLYYRKKDENRRLLDKVNILKIEAMHQENLLNDMAKRHAARETAFIEKIYNLENRIIEMESNNE